MTPEFYDESSNGRTIDTTVGQTFDIHLLENPTTGFHWQLTPLDSAACILVSDAFNGPAITPGRGGEHSWTFRAAASGRCDIELLYRRKWDDPGKSERALHLSVRVSALSP